jgi:hypothetical protein
MMNSACPRLLFTFGGLESYELHRASAAHSNCCCASCIAGTLLNGGSFGLLFVL